MFLFGFKSIAGSQPEVEPSPVDIVGRLADRISTSLLLEDKRKACQDIQGLSKKHRLEVGAHALGALTDILHTRPDPETLMYVLESLNNVTSPEVFDEEVHEGAVSCGAQFTEIFLKRPENVTSVIDILEENESFRVRHPAIRLLMNLLTNKPKEMQEIILSCRGVAKLIDVLSDKLEFIRNEVLLLLIHLTKSNANIQNIVAFDGGFNQLFKVIYSEGYCNGGVVVNDCLQLLLNLLERNVSNQTVFREESCIASIMPFFKSCHQPEKSQLDLPDHLLNDVDGDSKVWSEMKAKNVHSMLQVVRTLVSPANASQVVAPAQRAVASCGLLNELCNLIMAPGVPADVLSEIICTVGEMIRGCRSNQEFFGQVMASTVPPRSALVLLLMSMVNEKQPTSLRTAVLYCFQCYLYKNDISQGQIVQALLPTSMDALQSVTPGQLLCGGLFSSDGLSHWLSSVALSHALVGNTNNKELLLRVQLAAVRDAPPVSLLQQTFAVLLKGGNVQSRLGILTLLSTWLADCPNAVAQFLSVPNAVAFLTGQVASNEHDEQEVFVQSMCAFLLGLCVVFNSDSNANFTKESLCQVITRRIGVETFTDKLAEIAKHVVYTKALKHPQIRIENPADLAFDHEFSRLYKELEGVLAKAVAPSAAQRDAPSEQELRAVAKYKDVIRDQDAKIQHLQLRLAELEAERIATLGKIDELNSTVQQLTDENTLLKVQKNNNVIINDSDVAPDEGLLKQVEDLRQENERLHAELKRASETTNPTSNGIELIASAAILDSFVTHDDVPVCSFFRPDPSPAESDAELKRALSRIETLERKLAESHSEKEKRQEKLASLGDEIDKVKKDQEDLLVLLADQDAQVHKYKDRLKQLGQTVTDDEDDDDLDDDTAADDDDDDDDDDELPL